MTSPRVGVTPGCGAIFSGRRAMAVMACPRRASSATMREPAFPDAVVAQRRYDAQQKPEAA
jgi:hypothetical protein